MCLTVLWRVPADPSGTPLCLGRALLSRLRAWRERPTEPGGGGGDGGSVDGRDASDCVSKDEVSLAGALLHDFARFPPAHEAEPVTSVEADDDPRASECVRGGGGGGVRARRLT
jgi:hypothetical protein